MKKTPCLVAIAVVALAASAVCYKLQAGRAHLTTDEQITLRDAPFDPSAVLEQARSNANSSTNAKSDASTTAAPPHGDAPALAAGFREEPDSYYIDAPKGRFQVVMEQNGRDTRQAVLQERLKKFYPGKSIAEAQALVTKDDKSGLASFYIGILKSGDLVGAYKATGSQYQPYQIWSYPLNDKGETSKVTISGGKMDSKPAVVVHIVGASGVEQNMVILSAENTVSVGWEK